MAISLTATFSRLVTTAFDQSVLDLLRAYDVDYYTTDRAYPNAGRYDEAMHGNISVITDGESYIVSVWK